MITLANDSTYELMQAIALIEQKAERENKKAILRSMFARHHRVVARQEYARGDRKAHAKKIARALKLERIVADYANDLIY